MTFTMRPDKGRDARLRDAQEIHAQLVQLGVARDDAAWKQVVLHLNAFIRDSISAVLRVRIDERTRARVQLSVRGASGITLLKD